MDIRGGRSFAQCVSLVYNHSLEADKAHTRQKGGGISFSSPFVAVRLT